MCWCLPISLVVLVLTGSVDVLVFPEHSWCWCWPSRAGAYCVRSLYWCFTASLVVLVLIGSVDVLVLLTAFSRCAAGYCLTSRAHRRTGAPRFSSSNGNICMPRVKYLRAVDRNVVVLVDSLLQLRRTGAYRLDDRTGAYSLTLSYWCFAGSACCTGTHWFSSMYWSFPDTRGAGADGLTCRAGSYRLSCVLVGHCFTSRTGS